MAEMGTSPGPCITRKPSKYLLQKPPGVVPIMWQSTAAQCTAALACKGTQLRGRRWRYFSAVSHKCPVSEALHRPGTLTFGCLFLQPDYGGWEWGIRPFQAQTKSHAFQVCSGGGNFSLSFLKLLLPPSKDGICNITRALKQRVKSPETRPIEFYLAHKHLIQTRYIVRLFIGPKLPPLADFSVFVVTEYLLLNKNIFCLIHALYCKSQ